MRIRNSVIVSPPLVHCFKMMWGDFSLLLQRRARINVFSRVYGLSWFKFCRISATLVSVCSCSLRVWMRAEYLGTFR